MPHWSCTLLHQSRRSEEVTSRGETIVHSCLCSLFVSCRGITIALRLPGKEIKEECAKLLEALKQWPEAGELFEKAQSWDSAAIAYIKAKNWYVHCQPFSRCSISREMNIDLYRT